MPNISYNNYAFSYNGTWTSYSATTTSRGGLSRDTLRTYNQTQLKTFFDRWLQADNATSTNMYENNRGKILCGLLGDLTLNQLTLLAQISNTNETPGSFLISLISRSAISTFNAINLPVNIFNALPSAIICRLNINLLNTLPLATLSNLSAEFLNSLSTAAINNVSNTTLKNITNLTTITQLNINWINKFPHVISVVASGDPQLIKNGAGVVGATKKITLTLKLSEPILLPTNGIPSLTLNSGGTAYYSGHAPILDGSNQSDTLLFTYTVAAGESTLKLAVTGFNMNGAKLKNKNGININFNKNIGLVASDKNTVLPLMNLSGTILVNTTQPTITSITSKNTALKINDTTIITFNLSKYVLDFNANDISVIGGSIISGITGLGTRYTALLSANTNSISSITINVASAKFTDTIGNSNTSSSAKLTMSVDTIAPKIILVTSNTPQLKAGDVAIVTFIFNESVKNFSADDINYSGVNLINFSGSGTRYTAKFSPVINSTSNATISIASANFTDAIGNTNLALPTQINMKVDTTIPNIQSIISDHTQFTLQTGDISAIITFNFDEDVTNFTIDDISASGGSISNLSGYGNTYTAVFTANMKIPTATISLIGAQFNDAIGNISNASNMQLNININKSITLNGSNGKDQLISDFGNDTLIGNQGDDELSGGLGNDTYIFNAFSNFGNDVINEDGAGVDSIILYAGLSKINFSAASDDTGGNTDLLITVNGNSIRVLHGLDDNLSNSKIENVQIGSRFVSLRQIKNMVSKKWDSSSGGGQANVLASLNLATGNNYANLAAPPNTASYLESMGFDDAWRAGFTGQGVVVAVIDSGIHYDTPLQLTQNISQYSFNFVDNNLSYLDNSKHGGFVAGEIVGKPNDQNVGGGAYDAQLMMLKVVDQYGNATYENMAKAISHAVDHGANVINISLGGPSMNYDLQNALQYASDRNVVVCIAAGNDSSDSPSYPAIYAQYSSMKNCIAVGATQLTNDVYSLAQFSNRAGSTFNTYNYICAPGVDLLGYYGNTINTSSGTSMSAPLIAAQAAVLMSARPDFNAEQIIQCIMQSATPLGTPLSNQNTLSPDMQSSLLNLNNAMASFDAGNYDGAQTLSLPSANENIMHNNLENLYMNNQIIN